MTSIHSPHIGIKYDAIPIASSNKQSQRGGSCIVLGIGDEIMMQ
jgi:hypothetical protein